MDNRCARAFAAGGCMVLGTWLPGFSLWHSFQLELIGSPLACGGEPTFEDLAVAVQICQLAPLERARLVPPGFIGRRRLAQYRPRFLAELNRFMEWQADHLCGPELWQGEDSGTLKSPWQMFVAASLVSAPGKLALDEKDAWSLSPGVAAWRLAVSREASGHDPKIITEAENEALAEADAQTPEEVVNRA
jgi:hypothetical protein